MTLVSLGLRHTRRFHLPVDIELPGAERGEVEYAITGEEWFNRRGGR